MVALAALQAAVTLSWMAYAYYQPLLLAQFGFQSLAGILSWYLALASSTLGPLAGDASDRLVRGGGDRFPVVRAGVALAAASFLAVAVIALAEGGSPIRYVLPLFVAIWIAGMTIFQAPALALIRDVNSGRPLGPAMPPLVMATALPQALWPWVESLLAYLGGSVTFLVGGVAVVGTALALGRAVDVRPTEEDPTPADAEGGSLVRAVACGVASAVVALLATDVVPAVLSARAGIGVSGLAAIAAAVAACAATLGARLGETLGNGRALVTGLVVAALCYPVATMVAGLAGGVAVATILGVALGVHLATALPFALAGQPSTRAGLVTGLYLAGAALGSRLAGIVPGS